MLFVIRSLPKARFVFTFVVGCGLLAQAWAYPAVTIGTVNLRAGPDRHFPVVRIIPEHQAVDVRGCESDYQWCDVLVDNHRGWVKADYFAATFQETEINVAEKGVSIGLPIVAFALGAYWATPNTTTHTAGMIGITALGLLLGVYPIVLRAGVRRPTTNLTCQSARPATSASTDFTAIRAT